MIPWGMYRSAKIGKGLLRVERNRILSGIGTKPYRRRLRKFIRVTPGCIMPAVVPGFRQRNKRCKP